MYQLQEVFAKLPIRPLILRSDGINTLLKFLSDGKLNRLMCSAKLATNAFIAL